MVMEVIYQLTQRDFVDSLIAHRNRSPIRKWFLRLIVSIVFAAVAVTLFGVAMHPNSQAMLNATPLLVLGALLVVVMWIAPWRAARNQFSKQPAAQGREQFYWIKWEFTGDGTGDHPTLSGKTLFGFWSLRTNSCATRCRFPSP
jgi:hypothetical protein